MIARQRLHRIQPAPGGEGVPFVEIKNALFYMAHSRRNSILIAQGGVHPQSPLFSDSPKSIERFARAETNRARGPLIRVGRFVAVHTGSIATTVDRGILIAGPAHNWFHWLVEILPTIFLADRAEQYWSKWPLIIRKEPLEKPNFSELLAWVAPRHQVVTVPARAFSRVKKVIVLAPPTRPGSVDFGIFNRLAHGARSGFDFSLMKRYRAHLLEFVGSAASGDSPERVFLVRSESSNRQHNQSELIEVAQQFGFVTVDPEQYELKILWKILSKAQCVIGAQGAAWANTIICEAGSRGLQWSGGALRGEHFLSLAKLVGMRLDTLVGDGDHDGYFKVDLAEFKSRLETMVSDTNPDGE